ncbi:MAG: class I SAM-dependent methyltransferase [Candidatus Gracilibacteria bacterium]
MVFTTPLPDARILSLAPPESSSVLDIGCGYGRVLKHMYEMGYRDLTGIDVSDGLILRAKQLCPDAVYRIQDIESIQLEQKYDLILIMGVIEYILSDENQKEFFGKVSRALRPNGHVLLETFVLDPTNICQYMAGLLKTGHLGRFTNNSKGFECHHQSYAVVDRLVSEFFEVIIRTRQKFLTWTGYECNGYSLILRAK